LLRDTVGFTIWTTRSSVATHGVRAGKFVLDHLITGHDENLFSAELLGRGRELVAHAIKLLNGYMNYLKRAHKIAPVAD
jgi:hypothetical protein